MDLEVQKEVQQARKRGEKEREMKERFGAVLDSEMRVRGLQGVRVVDASVMPNIVSGNLNAPTQMIAMKGADMILGRVPLEKERPDFHFEI